MDCVSVAQGNLRWSALRALKRGRDVGVPLSPADIGERPDAGEHPHLDTTRKLKPALQNFNWEIGSGAEKFDPDDRVCRVHVNLNAGRYFDRLDYLLVAEFDVCRPETGIDTQGDHRLPFHAADLTTISPSWDNGGIVHTFSLFLLSIP
jgi:hypothetical protein